MWVQDATRHRPAVRCRCARSSSVGPPPLATHDGTSLDPRLRSRRFHQKAGHWDLHLASVAARRIRSDYFPRCSALRRDTYSVATRARQARCCRLHHGARRGPGSLLASPRTSRRCWLSSRRHRAPGTHAETSSSDAARSRRLGWPLAADKPLSSRQACLSTGRPALTARTTRGALTATPGPWTRLPTVAADLFPASGTMALFEHPTPRSASRSQARRGCGDGDRRQHVV